MRYRIEKIGKDNYAQYLAIVQQTQWGNILLPDTYEAHLWGGVVYEADQIVGGWVGLVRGNSPVVKWLAKSVYFDAYPVFISAEKEQAYLRLLMEAMRGWAEQEGIVMLNLTHWVRGHKLPYLEVQHNATFLLPLQETSDAQMKLIESSQRNKIRKGEKSGVIVRTYQKEEAVSMIPVLQAIREQTQEHAIQRNANASILLKSDYFFKELFLHTESTLFIGYIEDQPVTVLVVQRSGETACSYSGGSDYEINRKTGCSAYVRWKAIEYYREQPGVKYMDMGGVPVHPTPDDPAYGVYVFKRSFGGAYTEFDAGVIPINRFKYPLLKFVLSRRKILRLFSKVSSPAQNFESKARKTNYRIGKISSANYAQYVAIVQQTQWGNILLPDMYEAHLWGGVAYEADQIIGGWVGLLRGDKPVVKWLAKSVYFDAYPVFISAEKEQAYLRLLMEAMRGWAEQEGIVMLNLTHWVRGHKLPYLEVQHNATFLLPLQETSDAQWKLVESKQRNIVRKGEKNGVAVRALKGEEAIAELPTLQLLREQTQQHAIQRNANASMLLKSDQFFVNIFRHTDATLFVGSVEGKPSTVAVMIRSGETAHYYSGGSDYELNRRTGSSAYVIWKAIEYYREQPTIKYMDMGGVPVQPQPDDPAYGVYVFKRSFGGEYIEFDAGEIIISKGKHRILKFALSQRKLLRLLSKVF